MLPSLAAALVESSPDAVLVVDAAGQYQDANTAACRLLGYAREELLRLHFSDVIPPGEIWTEILAAYRAEGKWRGELDLRRKNGTLVRIDAWSVMIPGPGGKVYASFLRNIGAHRRAEEDLAATHQHTRDVLDRITDYFYAVDDQWRITYVNEAMERAFGCTRDEAFGRNIWERFPQLAQPELVAVLQQAFDDGQSRSEELADPQTGRTYEVRVYPSEVGLSVFFRDVSEQKQQQLAMQEALDAAQAGLRSKTRFLATMSHELRTPLQAVIGYADLLMSDSIQPLTPGQREDIAIIQRAAKHMATLIDDLLTLSQANENVTTALSPEELRRVVDQVRQEMAPRAAAKYVALVVDLPHWLPGVRADLMRLHRILRNLVENAIKFTDVGKVTIGADVTDRELEITVTDTGLGISAEALPHIFDAFYQGESAMSRRYEGAGLGLSIARRFAEQMGGRITITTSPGNGSAFTLHLALAVPEGGDDAASHVSNSSRSAGSISQSRHDELPGIQEATRAHSGRRQKSTTRPAQKTAR